MTDDQQPDNGSSPIENLEGSIAAASSPGQPALDTDDLYKRFARDHIAPALRGWNPDAPDHLAGQPLVLKLTEDGFANWLSAFIKREYEKVPLQFRQSALVTTVDNREDSGVRRFEILDILGSIGRPTLPTPDEVERPLGWTGDPRAAIRVDVASLGSELVEVRHFCLLPTYFTTYFDALTEALEQLKSRVGMGSSTGDATEPPSGGVAPRARSLQSQPQPRPDVQQRVNAVLRRMEKHADSMTAACAYERIDRDTFKRYIGMGWYDPSLEVPSTLLPP